MTTAYIETTTLLEIRQVSKSYDGHPILSDVSATIRDLQIPGQVTGQVVALVGPSGIGKSTLFRIIAGLEQPDSGEVLVQGRAVVPGMVGVVAQNYPLLNHRTVWGNLMRAAAKGGKRAAEVESYLREFDLWDGAQSYPRMLSGGQRQRAAILQQVLCAGLGSVICMDEPFSGLDPAAKLKAQKLIAKVAALDELSTIIVVTHDIRSAVEIADHIWIMGKEEGLPGGARITETRDLVAAGITYDVSVERRQRMQDLVAEIEFGFLCVG